ncbi:type II toxin-antitoxin system RelE/ParE family toxin [Umezawaea sp. NPDC059074]|uniref:type II toxin-antitoxin system RelE family toxin n=1 Tax=Umezawaea sp. NPDC059074 TaxID=3346716 RepID=UPI0036BDB023
MSPYDVQIVPSALKTLLKLDKPVRRRLQSAFDGLARDPRPHGAIALKGSAGLHRIRVGDYRVVYEIHDGKLVVLVVDLGHRSEIYRDL